MVKPTKRNTRDDLLAKFQDYEEAEEGFFDHQDEDEIGAPTLRGWQSNADFYPIEDNFKTLTIRDDDLATIRKGAAKSKREDGGMRSTFNLNRSGTPTLRPRENEQLGQQRDQEDEDDFLDGFEGLSPGTLSTSSPKPNMKGSRRMSLSEYSEEAETSDTDVTSDFNDADLGGDIDNIFGFDESGVYSSGGVSIGYSGSAKAAPRKSRAKEILQLKQKEMQMQAEQEESELLLQRNNKGGGAPGAVNTLKLKDFQNYNDNVSIEMDALENEKTINYEYTKDEYEDFEDGFDLSSPMKLPTRSRSNYNGAGAVGPSARQISNKMSMPQFDKEFKPGPKPAMKKYKSMMNVKEEEEGMEEGSHPIFNNRNNDIIRKLNRIPSFYSTKQQHQQQDSAHDEGFQLDHIDELESNNETYNANLDLEMEHKKKKLLEKYMEITSHQLRNKAQRTARKLSSSPNKKKLGSSLGLVRYLNDDGIHSVPTAALNSKSKMRFNPAKHRWEGNDIDLYKFESIKALPTSKPRLITKMDYKPEKLDTKRTTSKSSSSSGEKIVGNMRYDPEGMKWVSLDEVDEDDDIFDDLPDLPIRNGGKTITKRSSSAVNFPLSKSHPNLHKQLSSSTSTFRKSDSARSIISLLNASPPKYPGRTSSNIPNQARGVSATSAFTHRTASTASSTSSQDNNPNDDTLIQQETVMEEFFLDEKLIEKFQKEETKWVKKTKNWFHEGEVYDFGLTPLNKDYFWEIRKMVTHEEN